MTDKKLDSILELLEENGRKINELEKQIKELNRLTSERSAKWAT